MVARRARIYDALALLTIIVVIALDQWTKSLIVANLSPAGSRSPLAIVGKYLVIDYVQNRGAAFGLLANTAFLAVLIVVAVGVVSYLYLRTLNTGSLLYKLIFGLIIGGALGNLIDRVHNGGYVVDFISFRIPQMNYYFAIFNVADACISVGVFLLFVFLLFSRAGRAKDVKEVHGTSQTATSSSMTKSGTFHTTEQDAQS